ncbi:putative addiction module antidote protein [Rodentibacter rarus]|uniref:Putative addiction module antidote protein n=1 Tax=Rodentibacter rarus TaxID=1908260 RepID=A0A1V3IGZ4_9PAST|nr:addiction module antidote protein [Rodentibacter rarus]OOF39079.1 putative addiction module antidote protein [Rodentibacter rarus]OOF39808.1 putative addiction module antidote protein [Rodentibacter rarus]
MGKKIIVNGIELDEADLEVSRFDAAEYLSEDEELAELYLKNALETASQAEILQAFKTLARAKGMTQTAEKAGIARENLYRALSGKTEPKFSTMQRLANALGYELSFSIKPIST